MTCEELTHHLLTEATSDFDAYQAHLESCPYCAELAIQILAAEELLRSKETSMVLTFDDAFQALPPPRPSLAFGWRAWPVAAAAAAVLLFGLWAAWNPKEFGGGEPASPPAMVVDVSAAITAAEAEALFGDDPAVEVYAGLRALSIDNVDRKKDLVTLTEVNDRLKELDALGSPAAFVLGGFAALHYSEVGLSIGCPKSLSKADCWAYEDILKEKVHAQYLSARDEMAVPRLQKILNETDNPSLKEAISRSLQLIDQKRGATRP